MPEPPWSGGWPARPESDRPQWWPANEAWPPAPGAGARTWSGFRRRMVRLILIWAGIVIVLPLVISVILAVTVGGWTSVIVVIVSWAGLAVLLAIGLSVGLRSWRPVRSLIDTAGRLADGDYSARAESGGRAPLGHVTDSFNRMAERLERAEADRRQLLADVGHELRTPLTIIRGELEAMADGVHDPDEAELRRLLGDLDVVERLLDDLHMLSTAEAGMLDIHREQTDVVKLVQEVLDGRRLDAEVADVTLEFARTDGHLDGDVDQVRVKEIVANVVANALRATPPGGRIVVSVRRDLTMAVIRVADTGQGIPEDEIERVFDRFHRGSRSQGSGLGLTISRNLAIAHGGDIAIESEEGLGTTVTIRLPLDGADSST